MCFSNFFPATFGITEPLQPNSTAQEWENVEAISVGIGVTYMINLSQASVESCPQKYQIFKAIRTWENARAAKAFPNSIKKILSDANRQFHLEQIDNDTWRLDEVKSSGNAAIATLQRAKGY